MATPLSLLCGCRAPRRILAGNDHPLAIPKETGAAPSGPSGGPATAGGGASSGAPNRRFVAGVQPAVGTGPQAGPTSPVQGGGRSGRNHEAVRPGLIARAAVPYLGWGRNVRTANAVRNSAGASPKCTALGNARGKAVQAAIMRPQGRNL